jgi:hypothetical protein
MADKEPSWRSDPLSPATRNTKRQLLVVSVIALTFKAFEISIEKIPVAGLTINFDRGVFEFLIAIALIYLLLTFILYYYIDIRNFPETAHEENTKKWKSESIDKFIYDWYEDAEALLNSVAPPGYYIHLNPSYRETLRDIIDPKRKLSFFAMLKAQGILPSQAQPNRDDPVSISGPSGPNDETIRAGAAAKAKEILVERTRAFRPAFRVYLLKLWPRLFTVRTAYFVRNYLTDGFLPIFLGCVALLSMYDFIDVHFLARFVPHSAITKP